MEILWIALILLGLGIVGGYGWMLWTSITSQSTSHLGRQMFAITVAVLPLWIGLAGLLWALWYMEPTAAAWRAGLLLGWLGLMLLWVRYILFGNRWVSPDGSGELLMLVLVILVGTLGELILFVFC